MVSTLGEGGFIPLKGPSVSLLSAGPTYFEIEGL